MSISRDPSIGGGGLDDPIAEPMAEVRTAAADEELDRSLRPRRLADFVDQEQVTSQLEVFIEAATRRDEPLDHVLLAGPPGLGKTSLAHIIAAELGAPIVQTAGPALERKADIASFLTALEPGSVFFIDEIHRLNRAIEETLYPAMEDRQLPIVLGQGAGARTVTLDLPAFTLVGATTRAGLLTTPLRDRFGVSQRLEHYEPGDLAQIVRRSAGILEVGDRARWRARDRGTLARHAAGREPPPEAGPRLRRGSRRRRGHRRGCGRSPRAARGRRRRSRPPRPHDPRHDRGQVLRRPGRALDPGRRRRRGAGDDRGRLRAVSASAGAAQAHPAGAGDHASAASSTSGCRSRIGGVIVLARSWQLAGGRPLPAASRCCQLIRDRA